MLLTTWANLCERGWERLRAGLAAGDPGGEVAAVWLARELLAEVYAAGDLAHATRRLIVFFQHAADAEIPELCRLARTIDRWRREILAFHTTAGASNGPTEAVILWSRHWHVFDVADEVPQPVEDTFSGACPRGPRCRGRREVDIARRWPASLLVEPWRWLVRVQRVVTPVTGAELWTVVDDEWVPVVAVERYWRTWPGSSAHRTRSGPTPMGYACGASSSIGADSRGTTPASRTCPGSWRGCERRRTT